MDQEKQVNNMKLLFVTSSISFWQIIDVYHTFATRQTVL